MELSIGNISLLLCKRRIRTFTTSAKGNRQQAVATAHSQRVLLTLSLTLMLFRYMHSATISERISPFLPLLTPPILFTHHVGYLSRRCSKRTTQSCATSTHFAAFAAGIINCPCPCPCLATKQRTKPYRYQQPRTTNHDRTYLLHRLLAAQLRARPNLSRAGQAVPRVLCRADAQRGCSGKRIGGWVPCRWAPTCCGATTTWDKAQQGKSDRGPSKLIEAQGLARREHRACRPWE